MRTMFLILGLIFLSGSITELHAQTGKQIKVGFGQLKTVPGTRIKVKFISVVEDSRCPTGVNCMWAGNAKIKIQISKSGKAAKAFELNTFGEQQQTALFEGYEIRLVGVNPYPKHGVETRKESYVATIAVSKR